MDLSFCIFKGPQLEIYIFKIIILSMNIIFILANSVDRGEILSYHLGIHRLSKYLFTSIQNVKG